MRNLDKAARIVGSMPAMENIATLIEPPGSTLGEPEWIARIVAASGCGLLLDVQNVYANAVNFGFDPLRFLDAIPTRKHPLPAHRGRPLGHVAGRQDHICSTTTCIR